MRAPLSAMQTKDSGVGTTTRCSKIDLCSRAVLCCVLTVFVRARLLEAKGIPLSVAQWLGTSLAPGGRWAAANNNNSSNGSSGDQKLDWVFDISGAAALYNSYRQEAC